MPFWVPQDSYKIFDVARKQYEQFYNLAKDATIKWTNTEPIRSVLQQAQALKDRIPKQEGLETQTNQPEAKKAPAGDLDQKPLERGFAISFIDAGGNKAKYRFSLMPAIESQFKVPPGVQVPEVKPGILIRTAMKHRNIVIPGGAPVVQTIGIENTIINMVGLFVGEGDGVVAQQEEESTPVSEDSPEGKKSGLVADTGGKTEVGTDAKPKKRRPAHTAYQVADLFNSEVVQPGTKCLVEIVATASDEALMTDKGSNPMQPYNNRIPFSEYRLGSSSKIEHIKLEVIITSIRLLAAQADRCYYSIDGYVVNYHQEARKNPKVVLTVNGDVPVDDLTTKQGERKDNDHGLDIKALEQADAAPDIQRMAQEYRKLQEDLKAHQKELAELQNALDKDPSKLTPEQQRRYMELKTKIIPETKQKLNAKAEEIRKEQERFADRLRSRPDYHRIIDAQMLEAQTKIPQLQKTIEQAKKDLQEAEDKVKRGLLNDEGSKPFRERLRETIRKSEEEIRRIETGLKRYGITLDTVIPKTENKNQSDKAATPPSTSGSPSRSGRRPAVSIPSGNYGQGNTRAGSGKKPDSSSTFSKVSIYNGADQLASVQTEIISPYRLPTVPTVQGTEFVIRRNDFVV